MPPDTDVRMSEDALAAPSAKVGAEAIETADLLIETLQLATDASDPTGILTGILDGLASLVDHDAAGCTSSSRQAPTSATP